MIKLSQLGHKLHMELAQLEPSPSNNMYGFDQFWGWQIWTQSCILLLTTIHLSAAYIYFTNITNISSHNLSQ